MVDSKKVVDVFMVVILVFALVSALLGQANQSLNETVTENPDMPLKSLFSPNGILILLIIIGIFLAIWNMTKKFHK